MRTLLRVGKLAIVWNDGPRTVSLDALERELGEYRALGANWLRVDNMEQFAVNALKDELKEVA